LPLPVDFAVERDLPVPAVRVAPVEAFRAVFLPAAVPVAPSPAVALRVALLAAACAAVFSAVDFFTAVPDVVVLRTGFVPGVVFEDDVLDSPEAGAVLLAEARPAVFFAPTAVSLAGFPVACFLIADFFVADFFVEGRLADGVVATPLPAVVFLPADVPPADFIDFAAPLPRFAADLLALAAAVAGFRRGCSLSEVLAEARVDLLAALPAGLLAAVLLVLLAAGLLAPVVLPAAFRGLVVAMRLSRRNPLRCSLQRLLR
jgi:hypothetical protein